VSGPDRGDDLERITAFRRWTEDVTSNRIEPWRFGTALYRDDYPDRWDSNFLRVERPVGDATANELAVEADRALARFRHREFLFENDLEGARVATGLVELGYAADRLVYLALRRAPDREPPPLQVEEADFATVRPFIVQTNLVAHGGNPPETAEILADFREVLIDEVGARFFATRIDGHIVGCCELYVGEGVAQIESVDTLEAYRNRGVARAFLAAAITAARDAADLVFLIADAADWPQELYGKLGFDPVGTFRQFTKPPVGETDR
jgi:GNAT superfamily N-acetyltransferase